MKKLLATSFFVLGAITVMAQPSNPTNPVPLDGGIGLLIAAGAAYGAKKIYNRKKGDSQDTKAE